MDSEFLTCPQLLSDEDLRKILKDRYIDSKGIESMDTVKLLEIFKRVALPLPQRIYNQDKLLGKKLQNLRLSRNIKIANNEIDGVSKTDMKLFADTINRNHISDHLKSQINDSELLQKKICSSTNDQSEIHVDNSHNDLKRKCQTNMPTDSKKRQKITWP